LHRAVKKLRPRKRAGCHQFTRRESLVSALSLRRAGHRQGNEVVRVKMDH
jgi:hypothetical protein